MRKRRAILFNVDPASRNALKRFFDARDYETLVFREPMMCPVYEDAENCPGPYGCGDIVLMSYSMPAMNGIDLLIAQQQRGCRLSPSNKAIIAGALPDDRLVTLAALGAALFRNPLDFGKLEKWVAECESRMDLGRPVAVRRREGRQPCGRETMGVYFGEAEIGRAAVMNLSACGICFTTRQRLLPDQVITLRSPTLGIAEDALVRWIKTVEDGTFLVGLSFCI